MGLAGDSSDNIPGVPGIGPKTAQRLIKEFGSVEDLLSNLNKVHKEKERKKLEAYSEQAKVSRDLAKINCDVPVDRDWQELEQGKADRQALIALFRELEFRKLLQELGEENKTTRPSEIKRDYQLITYAEALEATISRIRGSRQMAICALTSTENPLESELVGVALAWEKESACYIPIGFTDQSGVKPLNSSDVLQSLAPIISDPGIAKFGHNIKVSWIVLKRLGIELDGVQFDPMLGAYVLDPDKRAQNLELIAREHLNAALASYEDLVGIGRKRRTLASVPLEETLAYGGDQAMFSLRLVETLDEKIRATDLASLYYDIELPLVRVLARMEMRGVRIDVDRLEALSEDFNDRLNLSGEKIHDMAGEGFNINSPQQLGRILFEKLGLPVGKKTKTGYSTSMEVLSALTPYHPLPGEVLNYRSLMKLKNTYIDALPRMVNSDSGRLHTSYNQTGTVTGRLSSSEPNLQNIPVRTAEGREIRRAFIAEPGYVLISADYSQIELRILAHYSEDEALVEAFRKGEDIHVRTAAEVFGVDPEAVNAEIRRQAKAINFGIIYGMSGFRLAKDLGIPQKTARQFIERYFERYKGVRSYIENKLNEGREKGYVTTLFKRKRFLPDLLSRNRNVRQVAERTAINTPIQGSAADIIKLAMIRIDSLLEQKALPARMIMQVHDELVFEVEADAAEEIANLVKHEMEAVVSLAVSLLVEVAHGTNWDEAH
jgi:DNA polymerase-1